MFTLRYSQEKPKGFYVSEDQVTNVSGSISHESIDEMTRDVSALNSLVDKEQISVPVCKGCGKHFVQTKAHLKWFASRKMPAPKRCTCCLNERKQEVTALAHAGAAVK